MANAVYPKYKKAAISGGANVDLLVGSVKLVLVDTGAYTYSAAHEFLSDIPSGARIATSGALTGKSVGDDASFKSANGLFTGVSGVSVEAWVMIIDTGAPSTTRLVFFQDTGVTGLPVTPAGANYNAIMDSAGWFQL
jgi:hypothetical protein